NLVALILLAIAFTASTSPGRLLEAINGLIRPLEKVGVNTEGVALAFSLTLTTIPVILQIARETRDAARARGLGRNPRALLIPFALRTVAHAFQVGEALSARGLGER